MSGGHRYVTEKLLNFPRHIFADPNKDIVCTFFTLLTHLNSVWVTDSCAPTIIRNTLIVIFYMFLCSLENIFQFSKFYFAFTMWSADTDKIV